MRRTCLWRAGATTTRHRAWPELNLNVTALHPEGAGPDMVLVALRVGRRDAAAVARSLARYGYETVDFDGPADTADDDTARMRAAALLRYLEM